MEINTKIKRCPFCGSHELSVSWIGEMAHVCCDKCGAAGGFGARPGEARELWNRRAGDR